MPLDAPQVGPIETVTPNPPNTATPPAHPTEERPATPPSDVFRTPPTPAGHTTLRSDEVATLREAAAELARIRAERAAAEETRRLEELQKEAGKTPLKALDSQREFYEARLKAEQAEKQAIENERLAERLEQEIDSWITGLPLVGETPEDRRITARTLKRVLMDEFESVRGIDRRIEVREKGSLRPAADALQERLSSRQLALFLKPTSRGGTGADGSRTPAPEQQPDNLTPFQARQKAYIDQLNSQNVGLRGIR